MTTHEKQSGFPVSHDPADRRFEADVDGRTAGYLTYELEGSTMVTTHTIVEPEFEGRGVASALAHEALGHARSEGLSVDPQCSFVHRFIERHAEYQDLVR